MYRKDLLPHNLPEEWGIQQNVPASRLTTIHIGGLIRYVAYPCDIEALTSLILYLSNREMPYRIIGNGSNILQDDAPWEGVWVITKKIKSVAIHGNVVKVGAGEPVGALIRKCTECDIGGLENLSGLPGTVGGAIRMNAGAYGTRASDFLQEVVVLDTQLREKVVLSYDECRFAYRSSLFFDPRFIILSCQFRFPSVRKDIIHARMETVLSERRMKQPLEYPSAGSVYRKPRNGFAGKWIEEAGCKGLRIGGACVSSKHAGFIVNMGDATASDVRRLMQLVETRVAETTGIVLTPEIQIW